ncbi:unnamed protein product [Bursaphelenchus xylophilus]|uniref:(pine wood nematode) hypothetical protein n=1 Tax=Bursaphelenchus xylophilus TaxID=6326 RepID=A0A1I7SFU0_BURXY|nr:unnamed protein product [Bursaphelenchus xylophilus]CAG9113076.1 unnamed protein product [Bursaphelenchus xylophilus]
MSKTYGPKPKSFALEDGNRYYIGAEVGQYLKYARGHLYKRFPQLYKRIATAEEKKTIQQLGLSNAYMHSTIMLLKETEVDEIFEGQEDKYRASASGGAPKTDQRTAAKTQLNWASSQVISGSHHLESVPCSTPSAYKKGRMTNRQFCCPPDDDDAYRRALDNAQQPVELVPIRLDMELDNIKLRDTFVFNKNEKLITPEMVAEAICEDLELPIHIFLPAIAHSIVQQLESHTELPLEPAGTDQRVVIKLNIHVGNQSLVDQFEWDISDKNNSPEEFAVKLCSDLGLGGEFVSAVAYSIRGQIAWNQKTYAFSESPLPIVTCPYRSPSDAEHWGPFLETLTDAEIEKKMRDQDRNTRRMRRLVNSNPYGM